MVVDKIWKLTRVGLAPRSVPLSPLSRCVTLSVTTIMCHLGKGYIQKDIYGGTTRISDKIQGNTKVYTKTTNYTQTNNTRQKGCQIRIRKGVSWEDISGDLRSDVRS